MAEAEHLNLYILWIKKKSSIFRDFFTCTSSSEAEVWVKPNLVFYAVFFFNYRCRTFQPLSRNFPGPNAFSILSTFYLLHLGLSLVPRFSLPWVCLLLQNILYPCPFPVRPALFIRWIIAWNHFTSTIVSSSATSYPCWRQIDSQGLKLSLRTTPQRQIQWI